jgi:hypothetical protein
MQDTKGPGRLSCITPSNPRWQSKLIVNSAQLTDSIPTETTTPLTTAEPVIPPSLPALDSPPRMVEAVEGDTKRPLDVLVVDDDK